MGIGALLVLWLGAQDVINGRMTVGELVAFNSYLMMLAWPMIAFGWVTNLLQRGAASWKRMLEVLAAEPAITDAGADTDVASRDQIRGDVEFRELTFSYGGTVVLRNISAKLPAGTTTSYVVPSSAKWRSSRDQIRRSQSAPPGRFRGSSRSQPT